MKKCPFCAEEIQDAAIKCRYCGTLLDTNATLVEKPTVPIPRNQLDDVRGMGHQGKKVGAVAAVREKTGWRRVSFATGRRGMVAILLFVIGVVISYANPHNKDTLAVGWLLVTAATVTAVTVSSNGLKRFVLAGVKVFLAMLFAVIVLPRIPTRAGQAIEKRPSAAPAPVVVEASRSSRKPVSTDGTAFEDICENWFFYRDRTIRLTQAGDEEGAAKARKQLEQNGRWLSDYPGREMPETKSGCR